MAGTLKDLRLEGRVLGSGLLWGGLPVPTVDGKLVLAPADADGFITPDATANPNAYPIGATQNGVTCAANATRTKHTVDEVIAPIDSTIQQVMMRLQANVHGLLDPVVQKLIGAGFMKQTIGTNDVTNTIGFVDDVFTGVALIAPLRKDPTKVFVFHVYKTINESGFEFGVRKDELGSSQATFEAYAVQTRPKYDQLGNWWFQKVSA